MSVGELQVANRNQLATEHIRPMQYGLEFVGTPPLAEWKTFMVKLRDLGSRIQWYLGDLFVFAESPVTGWGEVTYKDLMDHSGYSYQTLRNYTWIARRFPVEFREQVSKRLDKPIPWSFFQTVASLGDAEVIRLLTRTGEENWSLDRLEAEVRMQKPRTQLGIENDKRELPYGWEMWNDPVIQARAVGFELAPQGTPRTGVIEHDLETLIYLRDAHKDDPKTVIFCEQVNRLLENEQ